VVSSVIPILTAEIFAKAPLTYNPLLSTLIRSQVPAPSINVQTHAAAAGKLPIIVLLTPVVIADPEQYPIAILLPVALLLYNEQ